MPINKKMTVLAVVLFALSCLINWGVYQTMETKARPEIKENIVVLAKDLPAGSVLGKEDLTVISINASAAPIGAAKSTKEFEGKRLILSTHKGQFFFSDMVADRGLQRSDTARLYLVGLDVENISNYLGCQLKAGEKYQLYDKSTGLPILVCPVTIDKLVDSNGKDVTGSDSPVKTINVGVSSQAEMEAVMSKKGLKALEIVRLPQS